MTMTKTAILQKAIASLSKYGEYENTQLIKEFEQELILAEYEGKATKPNEKQLLSKVTKWMEKEYKHQPNKILTTCHYLDGKQLVANNYIMMFLKNELPLPYDADNVLTQDTIGRVYNPIYTDHTKYEPYVITSKIIKAAKALKLEYIEIKDTVLAIKQIEVPVNFSGDITIYPSDNKLQPAYFDGELINGVICPCRAKDGTVIRKIEELQVA